MIIKGSNMIFGRRLLKMKKMSIYVDQAKEYYL